VGEEERVWERKKERESGRGRMRDREWERKKEGESGRGRNREREGSGVGRRVMVMIAV
jgi:hypothetical protein